MFPPAQLLVRTITCIDLHSRSHCAHLPANPALDTFHPSEQHQNPSSPSSCSTSAPKCTLSHEASRPVGLDWSISIAPLSAGPLALVIDIRAAKRRVHPLCTHRLDIVGELLKTIQRRTSLYVCRRRKLPQRRLTEGRCCRARPWAARLCVNRIRPCMLMCTFHYPYAADSLSSM